MTRRHLILMRHGEAASSAMGGDRERPLTERGRMDATQRAEWLRAHDYGPDRILSSDALRARETAECLRAGLGLPDEARVDEPDAYAADPGTLMDIISRQPADCLCLAFVAHNPGMGALVAEFHRRAGMGGSDPGFPAAAVAVFEAEGEDWGTAIEIVRPLPSPPLAILPGSG